ncbi:MAG: proteasome beta subunit [Myxococcota bacterium]
MHIRDTYQGSSFWELLRNDYPTALPDFSAWNNASGTSIPHGTTVLAFKFADGVLVAGDRLATEGHRVASRDVEKVFATDNHSLMAISGAAGPCIEMGKILSVELEHYEKIEGEALELEGKANKLGQMIRQNLPAAMQGLVVVPLFAGFDLRRNAGRLWKYDITGGRYEETEFEATGSGGIYASESLKKSWRADLSAEEAVGVAVTALTDAADQDRATGGVDLQRKIFPIVNLATANEMRRVEDDEIEQIYRDLIASRSVDGGGTI